MIDNLRRIDSLDIILSKMSEKDLNAVYLRVFSSPDGELVLQDLANRLHEYIPAQNDFEEGQRSAYVSILSRLQNAVSKKENVNV